MSYSERLVASIKTEEGFTSPARHLAGDPAGVITGAYGDTDVVPGQRFTPEQAETMLRARLDRLAAAVSALVKVPLTQGQFDALLDFAYNEGAGALERSTLLVLLNSGDYQGADAEFSKWNLAGGKVLAGLEYRRALEASWFETPATAA